MSLKNSSMFVVLEILIDARQGQSTSENIYPVSIVRTTGFYRMNIRPRQVCITQALGTNSASGKKNACLCRWPHRHKHADMKTNPLSVIPIVKGQ